MNLSESSHYERLRQALYEEFGAKVAAIAVYYGGENTPRRYFSAHFFEFGETWALVTAGHCLREILEDRESGSEPTQILIFDPMNSTSAALPIRLEYEKILAIDDEKTGADYGFVPLASMYSDALKSAGTSPCSVHNIAPSITEFDTYFLFGYPFEHTVFKEGLESVTVTAQQTALRLTKIDNLQSTQLLRIQFECNLEKVEGLMDLHHIAGMSGGLVVGLRRNDTGEIQSGVLGVQSSWFKKLKVLNVCPHDAFFKALMNAIT